MELLFQRSVRSLARIKGNGKLAAEAVLLSTDTEMTARIEAACDSFLIDTAEWESLRSGSHYAPQGGTALPLLGAQAYFGVSTFLNRAFPEREQRFQRALFAECIKAVIQSECFLYPQRGFADKQAYQASWDASHPNSCRYYSNLDLVSRRWFDYIGEEGRSRNLFHRHKNLMVWRADQGSRKASGSFLDSFHELAIEAECGADGRISKLDAGFLRAPDPVCFETVERLTEIIGREPDRISRRDLSRCIGGSEGCAHLLDLTQDLLQVLQRTFSQNNGMSD